MTAAVDPKNSEKKLPNSKRRFMFLFLIWYFDHHPGHGYSLIEELNSFSVSPCKSSTIYSVLDKLEKLGYVKSKPQMIGKRLRKIYSATEKGRGVLESVKKNKIKGKLREFMSFLLS